MSKVKFKYGTAEQLANAPYLEGTFYVISDDNSTDGILYADLHGNRICFGDVASLVKKVSKLESSAQDTKIEVDWLRSNIIKNTLEKDTTVTADDVHTVPPQEIIIYGKSEQKGIPTPAAPVSIDSLDNKFTLHVSKNGTTDYGDWPILFDLGSYILRSLPDGTCDTLHMSYFKPSEDAGWAMYDTTLKQTITSIALANLEWTQLSNGIFQGKNIPNSANGVIGTHQILCDTYREIETQSNSADMIGNDDKTIAFQSDYPYIFVKDTDYTNLNDFIASLGTSEIIYPLDNPIIHSLETVEFLGTVELPSLPNPMTAWVDDGNVQPDISITYEVDNEIYSSNLIHAETDVSLDGIRNKISSLENIDRILTNRLVATEADIDNLEVTKANINSLEAAEARIDELEVSSATIQNLEATNARIGDLETDSLRVKNRLTAAEADIENLEAVNVNVIGRLRAAAADIEELTASKATVDDLIAVNANIQELEATNATITGKLTAAEASIEDLEAENATITGTLTAAQASIEDLEAENATITGRLEANEASIGDLEATNATITGRLEATEADINTLTASKADITDLNAATARIGSLETDNVDVKGRLSATEADIENLEATTATIESLNAEKARIDTLETNKANVTDLTAATGRIGTLEANTADINTIRANSAKVANLTAQELEADHATIGSLDANYAQVNMANVNNAWIQNGTVKDGAISNAMINSVSANKLTAGTIDASNITVTNLNADNITTGTINGQRIGQGSLSLDKLEENVYTEDEVNSIVDNLQNQIDGAIETWTGTEIPTLSNTPASDWTTDSIKDRHVGDIYFIVNSQSDQNGYNYRFTKIGNTYSWQLIKDSDVTQVLQRLTDAEGKIGDIEQFDTTISSWKNDTDNELSSIKSAATTLAGRVTTAEGTLATKVDTTTFNTLSQTVDGHSSSISQLTTETTTLTQAVDTLNTKTSSDSGNIVQFDNSIGFKEIVVHGKSVQDGIPTPDAPVEIESVDNLTLNVCGKNLLPKSAEATRTYRGMTFSTTGNGEVVINGTFTTGSNDVSAPYGINGFGINANYYAYVEIQENYAIYLPAGTYTFSATITNRVGAGQAVIVVGNIGQTVMTGASYKGIISGREPQTFTTTGGFAMLIVGTTGNVATVDTTISNIQLELDNTATDYEPYIGQSINIPLGDHQIRSLPDGTDDTLTFSYIGPSIREGWGLYNMKLMQRCKETAMSELSWSAFEYSNVMLMYTILADMPEAVSNVTIPLCDIYKTYASSPILTLSNMPDLSCAPRNTFKQIYVKDSNYIDAATFKVAVTGHKLVYPLATPIIHDFDTIELPLSKDLNLWASTSPSTTINATWWHEPGRAEKNEINISRTAVKLNETVDTVDEHTRKISSLETTVETKADGSEITTINNKLNTVSDTVDGHTQSITSLNNTVATKADGSEVATLNNKLNTVSDTVDEHTQSISSLNSTIATKADNSEVTTLNNRVNTISDTVDGHTQSISSLNTTMATKADSSSLETVSNRVNSISDTVDGHTQSISSINSTVATKADSSTVTILSNNVNSISETVDGHTQSISSLNTTVATKADGSALTTVSNKVNTISDTVDEHSQSISSINTTLDTKADGSALTTVSNKLNTVSDTVDGHTQSISSINTALETKVDSSTVSSLTTKVNNISDTVDGHTQTIGSVQNTQTQMQSKLNKTIVETTQLWYSKANTEAPAKPTSQITSTSTDGNAWRIVVPVYNASYPNYFYCYQWKYTDGTYGWSGVTRDIATGESQERARTAITDASSAVSTAASAQATAESASTNANQAKENASSAVSLANTASTNASSALSTANTASSNASTALSTANSAASDASSAVSTANTAKATADKNVKTSLQLWFTKANETAPNKPTARVTSTSTDGNAWRVVVPTYSVNYPYYFYCYQYELADGTYTWSDVVYDRATTENQSNSRNAVTGVSTLTTKTNTISDTVDQHSQSISSLNTTVATKADNSTVTTLSNNLSTLEQDVNGFKTTVSETYSTKNELAEVQDDISDLQAGSKLSDTKSGNIITIDDALDVPPIDITIYGKSTQANYTGKNLLNPQHFNSRASYVINENNSITIKSSDGASWDAITPLTLSPRTYTISWKKQRAGQIQIRTSEDHYSNNIVVAATDTYKNFTITSDGGVKIKLGISVGSSSYPYTEYAQLEVGSTATAYEPYVGAKAAPNPDYPQEINSVDDLTLHITGKNLCGGDFLRDSVQNAMPQATTGTDDAGDYIRFTGAMAQYGPTIVSGMFKPDTQYTFIIKYQGETAGNVTQLSVVYTDGTSQGPVKTGITAGTVTTATYVSLPNKTVDHLMSYWYSGATRIYYNECGIFEGILTETDFEAYIGKSIEIPLGNYQIRDLPNGTRDTLTLSYVGPSTEHEGWAWYSRELVRNTALTVVNDTENWKGPYNYPSGAGYYTSTRFPNYTPSKLCNYAANGYTGSSGANTCYFGGGHELNVVGVADSAPTLADWKALLAANPLVIQYCITPTTETLDPIELPILPNPLTAWAEGGSAQPNISIDYWLNNAADIIPHLLDLDAVSKNNITAIESRVHTAESTIDQHSESIALKANSSDVYTKTQSDGLIATEVTNRNAAIAAATDAIELSVSQTYTTKTEFDELEIGGRNLVRGTSFASDSDLEYWLKNQNPILSVESGSLKIVANQTSSTPGVYTNISVEEGKYTVSFWYKVITENGMKLQGVSFATGNRNAVIPHNCAIPISDTEWHYYEHIFEPTATQAANISTLAIFLYPSGYAATDGIYIRHLKLEKGNRATDWTPAPEDVTEYTDNQVEAAKAAIKVTTDGISTEVSKINSVKYVNANAPSWALSAIKLYAAEGRTENWNIASTTGLRVGDTVYVKGTDSTRNCPIYIKTTVTSINSATNFTGKSHGYEDMLPVDSAISTINQSAESIKIQASKVEIDGTAIFTNSDFQSQLSSQNYATTTQVSTAKSEAISTAATDATNKANTAKSEAISAAATDATNKAAAAEQNAKTYAEGQASTVNSSLEAYKSSTNSTLTALQNQVDGQIEAWYKSTDPTTSNDPASTWNTDTLKARHEGDIYYNVENGHSWRWMKSGNTYSWQQIPDSDAAAALATAQNAQTIANSKRRIFTTTPTVPYDVGDLWVDGSSVKYCSTAKTDSEIYSTNDWTTTATDDSGAIAAINSLQAQMGTTEALYSQVEWVESNGRQFCQLDWTPDIATYGFEIDFLTKSAFNTASSAFNAATIETKYGCIFGTRNASGVNDTYFGTYSANGLIRTGATTGRNIAASFKKDKTRQQIKLHGTTLTNSDGTTTTVVRQATTANKYYQPMCVFACVQGLRPQVGGSIIEPSATRIYSLKFFDDEILAVDLVPAIRKRDNMTGLYDKVSKHFYPSPTLTYGEVIGDLGDPPSIKDSISLDMIHTTQTDTAPTRLIHANAPALDELADGQRLELTLTYSIVASVQNEILYDYTTESSSASAQGTAYLKLTLKDGSETRWLPLFVTPVARLTNAHYNGGTTLDITYIENRIQGNNTAITATMNGQCIPRALVCGQYKDDNTTYNLGQNLWYNNILAKEEFPKETLIVGEKNGYAKASPGAILDLDYPILWTSTAFSANGSTYSGLYTSMYDRVLSTNHTITDGVANSMVYLVGTISGKRVTLDNNYLRCTIPTTFDGLVYIPIGKLGNQSTGANYFFFDCTGDRSLFMFLENQFQQVTASTIVATQKLYYRTTSLTAPIAPTTWITTNNPATYNAWNLAVPPLAASKEANATKYPYLYSVEQHKRVDGTVVTSEVSNDSNTTIIDGGSIITNSVTATQIAAGTITANEISSGAITTDKLDANAVTAAKIDATDLHVSAANIDGTITFGQLSGVQASGDYALNSAIPTKVSDLTNDSEFQTSSQVNATITSKNYATQTALNTEINQRKAQYGTSSTAAGTAAKAVTCANFELEAGNEITVKFTTANTSAAKVQLNVNSKGAKDIWVGNAVTSASNQLLWGANAYITFKYDGTQFQVIGEPRTWYGACTTAQATAAKAATITGCVVCKGAKVELAMTYANSAASPTLNVSSVGAKNIYFGTGTTQPLISNGTSWLQSNTATFTFDGAVWRTQGKTYIDANSIVTGYINADRIEAGSISGDKITAGSISGDKITGGTLAIGAFPESTQTDILNSNIHVPSTVAELTDSSDYATKTDAQGYANGKDSAIAAAAKRTDVSIAVTAINYTNNTATLQATLYIDGTATTSGVTYKWLKDGAVISGQTSRTLSVTSAMGLSHVYSCTVTYS